MEHKESYASGDKFPAASHGPGGLKAALARQPNTHSELNDTPCGPYSHCLGYSGDGGMMGDTTTKHRGSTYHFK